MYDNKFISVTSQALDLSPVTNCYTISDPLPPRAWRTLWTALFNTSDREWCQLPKADFMRVAYRHIIIRCRPAYAALAVEEMGDWLSLHGQVGGKAT